MSVHINSMKRYFLSFLCLCCFVGKLHAQSPEFATIQNKQVHFHYHQAVSAPTVVLQAGARSHMQVWSELIPLLEKEGFSVLAYDRPGLGQSEFIDTSRDSRTVANELKALMDHLEITGEFILVGHSMGGVYQTGFNALFPEKVKGLLMIDSPTGAWEGALQACLSPSQNEERNSNLENMRSNWPEVVQAEHEGAAVSFELLNGLSLPNPVTIISGGNQSWPEAYDGGCLSKAWGRVQKSLLKLSESSTQVMAVGSGHYVPRQNPGLILEAIKALNREK